MPLQLQWRGATSLPVAAEGLSPAALAALSPAERDRWPLRVGNRSVPLAELFRIDGSLDDGHLVLDGDLRQVRRLGSGMTTGNMTIWGDAGVELGAEMTGGTIEVEGSAGDWAGAALGGGLLRIKGNAGKFLGAAYPGSLRGMREGVILVEGTVGDEAGLLMRRGLIAIAGAAGDGLGRALIAGSIFAFGPIGRLAGAGMKRGTLALYGLPRPSEADLLPTFAPSGRLRPHFITIYLRRLREWGFPVPESAFSGPLDRYNGDLGTRGQGEVLIAVASASAASCPSLPDEDAR
jgi:formylmethanofuran dehydrogenase subunit C